MHRLSVEHLRPDCSGNLGAAMSSGMVVVRGKLLPGKPWANLQPCQLFMSGYASDLIARAGVPELERFVLHKPFTRESLLTKVRSILDEAGTKS